MFLLVFCLHLDVRRGHSIFPKLLGGKLPTGNLKSAKFRAEMLDRAAGIDQRTERHVAANARKTIKIREFHREKPPHGRTSSSNCLSAGFRLILSAQTISVKPRRR